MVVPQCLFAFLSYLFFVVYRRTDRSALRAGSVHGLEVQSKISSSVVALVVDDDGELE